MRVRLDSIGSQESELIEFTVFANNELIMKRSPPLRWLALFPASAVIIVVGCGYDNGLKLATQRQGDLQGRAGQEWDSLLHAR